MSGDGMEDDWLWDERGYIQFIENKLSNSDLKYYLWIKRMRELNKCSECYNKAKYRYAPDDGKHNRPESERWRCHKHVPYDATDEGWNGEWDYFKLL